jgi:hypothetical protein
MHLSHLSLHVQVCHLERKRQERNTQPRLLVVANKKKVRQKSLEPDMMIHHDCWKRIEKH